MDNKQSVVLVFRQFSWSWERILQRDYLTCHAPLPVLGLGCSLELMIHKACCQTLIMALVAISFSKARYGKQKAEGKHRWVENC